MAMTLDEIKTLPLSELEGIYTATFGVFPAKWYTREHYISIFKMHLKFGREIKPAIKWNT